MNEQYLVPQGHGQLARIYPADEIRPLDVYRGGESDEEPRMDWLATISAGERGQNNVPKRSQQGEIYLHDPNSRALGLKKALEVNGWKHLTVAFPSNDPRDFLQQHFVRYSQTRLEAFGDKRSIQVLDPKGGRHVYLAGSEAYLQEIATCKVSCSLFFVLAQWQQDGSSTVILPDGAGVYRLRTTSRNSLRNFIASIRQVSRFTRGQLMGIPFELAIDFREVVDTTGAKRKVPVWTLVMRPPETIMLTSRTFRQVVQRSLAEGAALMLPMPQVETWETAEREVAALEEPMRASHFVRVSDTEVVDRETGEVLAARPMHVDEPSQRDIELMAAGGVCDVKQVLKTWHVNVKGTRLATEEGRHEFVRQYTEGRFASLRAYLEQATEDEAARLLAAAGEALRKEEEPTPSLPTSQPISPISEKMQARWNELKAEALQWQVPVPNVDFSKVDTTLVQALGKLLAARIAFAKLATQAAKQGINIAFDANTATLETVLAQTKALELRLQAPSSPPPGVPTDAEYDEYAREDVEI